MSLPFTGRRQGTLANCNTFVTIVIGRLSGGLSTYKTPVLLQTFLDGNARIELEEASDLSRCGGKTANTCDNQEQGRCPKAYRRIAGKEAPQIFQSEPDWG
jgi:hypothetical protein